ncbi:MAG: hypothetical protein N3E44_06035 [Candidatus Bathyarchaeota archaeon]|nr:hypothetical protein [Candidatus Bathyarchaeota archaeon]
MTNSFYYVVEVMANATDVWNETLNEALSRSLKFVCRSTSVNRVEPQATLYL